MSNLPIVPLQQMTVFSTRIRRAGEYSIMESCLNYFWQNLPIPFSLHSFCSFLFIELGEACPVAELPDITYTSRLRYFTPTRRKSRRSRYCDSRCSSRTPTCQWAFLWGGGNRTLARSEEPIPNILVLLFGCSTVELLPGFYIMDFQIRIISLPG